MCCTENLQSARNMPWRMNSISQQFISPGKPRCDRLALGFLLQYPTTSYNEIYISLVQKWLRSLLSRGRNLRFGRKKLSIVFNPKTNDEWIPRTGQWNWRNGKGDKTNMRDVAWEWMRISCLCLYQSTEYNECSRRDRGKQLTPSLHRLFRLNSFRFPSLGDSYGDTLNKINVSHHRI